MKINAAAAGALIPLLFVWVLDILWVTQGLHSVELSLPEANICDLLIWFLRGRIPSCNRISNIKAPIVIRTVQVHD